MTAVVGAGTPVPAPVGWQGPQYLSHPLPPPGHCSDVSTVHVCRPVGLGRLCQLRAQLWCVQPRLDGGPRLRTLGPRGSGRACCSPASPPCLQGDRGRISSVGRHICRVLESRQPEGPGLRHLLPVLARAISLTPGSLQEGRCPPNQGLWGWPPLPWGLWGWPPCPSLPLVSPPQSTPACSARGCSSGCATPASTKGCPAPGVSSLRPGLGR